MQIRCYRCGWSFAVKREEAAFVLEALEESGGTHYDTRCPKCRHSNRVSLEQIRAIVPRPADQQPEEETLEESVETTAEGELEDSAEQG